MMHPIDPPILPSLLIIPCIEIRDSNVIAALRWRGKNKYDCPKVGEMTALKLYICNSKHIKITNRGLFMVCTKG